MRENGEKQKSPEQGHQTPTEKSKEFSDKFGKTLNAALTWGSGASTIIAMEHAANGNTKGALIGGATALGAALYAYCHRYKA